MTGVRTKAEKKQEDAVLTDAMGSDPAAIEANAGTVGRALIGAVDKAVHIQGSTIRKYVDRLRRKNPDATPEQIQKIMDRHFLTTVSGTGAGVGAAAAIPGIGFFTGAAAVAGESVVFLDFAAVYTVASAYLRGVDIQDPDRRSALVLTILLGAKGSAIVDSLLGESVKDLSLTKSLTRFSGPSLKDLNNRLLNTAVRRATRKFTRAWIGKLLPLGLGAIAGTLVNRKLARQVIRNASDSLGPTPARFLTEISPVTKMEDIDQEEVRELERLASTQSDNDKDGALKKAAARVGSILKRDKKS
ncbi:hypothetical protein QP027_04095 [Corynebacterium breve]|uniref:EcsC family protein n=1 Tax=Corynebacterium breve TaxID=3049799 RepID=A0ABY8VFZ6_9CORY|nr:hypothetical protein [Corynebacterium breve]WIM68581.1 hypothetical protein QP027_04095 [Corynebacterium breve]